jgi:CheY-like chemotaxis protein
VSTEQKRVLCIDDEQSGLTIRKMLLESSGFVALTATSGREGLKVFDSQSVDAVVVDYLMPEMDGGAVSVEIKRRKPRTPVIMLSAYASAREDVLKVIDAFVEKGGSPAQLLNIIESLIKVRSHSHPELQSEYVIFANSSGRCVDCSEGVCQLLDYSRAELLDKTMEDIRFSPNEVLPRFEKGRQPGSLEGDYILLHKTGRHVPVNYRSYVFPDGCMAAVWDPIRS